MDNRTRVVKYADEESVKELCIEIAALDKRIVQLEQIINTMKNASQFYNNITISNDVAIAGNVVQWDINTQRYVPINVKGNYA